MNYKGVLSIKGGMVNIYVYVFSICMIYINFELFDR